MRREFWLVAGGSGGRSLAFEFTLYNEPTLAMYERRCTYTVTSRTVHNWY